MFELFENINEKLNGKQNMGVIASNTKIFTVENKGPATKTL
jgi:hypothetical protein